jgi:aldehyde:ferredoxin oxidoreductase
MDLNYERFTLIGKRLHNIEKAINSIHGRFSKKDDYPPKRYWEEPVKSGPYEGDYINHDIWEKTLSEYYSLHGWDPETGFQTREGLEQLGLGVVANRLESEGLLKQLNFI